VLPVIGELRRPADRPVFEELVAVARQVAEAGDPTALQGCIVLLLHLQADRRSRDDAPRLRDDRQLSGDAHRRESRFLMAPASQIIGAAVVAAIRGARHSIAVH
jgi:hypothetical protein